MGWLILILFIIIVLIVWIALTRNTKETPDFEISSHDSGSPSEVPESIAAAAVAPVSQAPAKAPETVPSLEPVKETAEVPLVAVPPVAVKKDDLTVVEGIGPKVSALLNEAGIMTFDQLSAADEDRLKQVLERSGLRFIDPSSWSEQAKLASEGKTADLEALQQKLKAGRKIS